MSWVELGLGRDRKQRRREWKEKSGRGHGGGYRTRVVLLPSALPFVPQGLGSLLGGVQSLPLPEL